MSKKFITSLLLLNAFFHTLLYPAVNTIWLPNDIWKLVGYKGIYASSGDAKTWDEDRRNTIIDVADDKITYITPNSTQDDHLYNYIAGATASVNLTANTSTQIGASIGVFAIKGAKSPRPSNPIELDGTTTNTVKLKFPTVVMKSDKIPMYSMYLGGNGQVPVVKIIFQANYQGEFFRVKFGDEKEAYIGYFNYDNTFDNPATLINEKDIKSASQEDKKVNILDAIDFNMTDNNTSLAIENLLNPEDSFRKLQSGDGDKLIVYRYNKNGGWEIFNSDNTNSENNSFTQLEEGKAYWMRASSELAHKDGNITKIGLITSSNAKMDDMYLDNLPNGWNMLMFDDTYIRYSTTGIRIPLDDANQTNILFERPDGDRGQSKQMTILAGPYHSPTLIGNKVSTNSVRYINTAVEAYNILYGYNKRIRAFPAMSFTGTTAKQEIVLLSDSQLFVGSRANTLRSLTNQDLIALNENQDYANFLSTDTYNAYASRYGEFMMVARLNNDINKSSVNASMKIAMPSISSTAQEVTDLNKSIIEKVVSIKDALIKSATNSKGELRTEVDALLVDVDIDIVKPYSNESNFTDILLAAGERFSIQDTTYTRAYRYIRDGDFKIVGKASRDVILSNVKDNNITRLQNAFATLKPDTKVDFKALGADEDGNLYFSITSNEASDLDLLENEKNGTTLFEEIPLSSALIPEANRTFVKGAISHVFNIDNLLSTKVDLNYTTMLEFNGSIEMNTTMVNIIKNVDNNNSDSTFSDKVSYMVDDLKSNVVWTVDFPKNSLVNTLADKNKEVVNILTSNLTDGSISVWESTDLTKDPDSWYGNTYNQDNKFDNDNQNIFRINSNKGYMVKLRDRTPVTGTIAVTSELVENSTPHFDNSIKSVKDPIAPVSNDINHRLVISFNEAFINPLTSSFYDVIAIIDGKKYHLRNVGRNFQLTINNKEMGLVQKKPGDKPYPILIEAYDGLGNMFKENINNNRFNINYIQPPMPKLRWNAIGELEVTNRGNYEVRAFRGFISDVQRERDKREMEFNATKPISSYVKELGWEKDTSTKNDDGAPVALRIVSKDKKTGMYSDAIVTMYAPLRFGHVLEVNATDIDNRASIPFSFIQGQYLVKQPKPLSPTNKVFYNSINGINGGVQLIRNKKAIEEKKPVKFAYYPFGGKDKEDENEISIFGGNYTMYFKVKSTDTLPIASIIYIPDYAGSLFYIQYDGQLYMGRFPNSNQFNSDSSAYVLKGKEEFNTQELVNLGTNSITRTLQDNRAYQLGNEGKNMNFGVNLPVQEIFNGKIPEDFQAGQTTSGNSGNSGNQGNNNNQGNGGNNQNNNNNNQGNSGNTQPVLPTP